MMKKLKKYIIIICESFGVNSPFNFISLPSLQSFNSKSFRSIDPHLFLFFKNKEQVDISLFFSSLCILDPSSTLCTSCFGSEQKMQSLLMFVSC